MSEEKVRYTLILSKPAHARLKAITDEFGVTQAEAIEALVLHHDPAQWSEKFKALRESKVNARTSKRATLAKLSKLTPEQLALVAAQLG